MKFSTSLNIFDIAGDKDIIRSFVVIFSAGCINSTHMCSYVYC